jgi:hypothetical protein
MRAPKAGRLAHVQPTMFDLPDRETVPSFWVCGVLYQRIGTGRRCEGAPLVPVEEQAGRRLYRVTQPGIYDVMLADRIVSFVCWKGQIELIESIG